MSFKFAAGLLGLVVVALVAIAGIRVHAAGSFENALDDDRGLGVFKDWWHGDTYGGYADDCEAYIQRVAASPDPDEGQMGSNGDRKSETVDGHERNWWLDVSIYRDATAASRAVNALRIRYDPDGLRCFEGDLEEVPFPATVADGFGVGESGDYDGERGQSYTAVWQEGERVMTLDLWTDDTRDVSGWVREQYEQTRERAARTAID